MRQLKLLTAILFLVLSLIKPDTSWSCSCQQSTLPEHINSAYAIFSGTVIGREKDERKWQMEKKDGSVETVAVEPIYRVKFAVDYQWKGGDLPKETTIITSAFGPACGVYFQLAARYLVYAHKDGNGLLNASSCSRTKPYERTSEDLEALKALSGK